MDLWGRGAVGLWVMAMWGFGAVGCGADHMDIVMGFILWWDVELRNSGAARDALTNTGKQPPPRILRGSTLQAHDAHGHQIKPISAN